MNVLQLESGFIDLPKGLDFPIDIDTMEITQNGSRAGGYSKTIELPGTDNNTSLLGAYFDCQFTLGKFNRKKKAKVSVLQDGVEVFNGYLQLLEISHFTNSNTTTFDNITFKIRLFDELGSFFTELGNRELTDLPMNEFSHLFNRANIMASWSNTEGVIYPMYAKSHNTYVLRDFFPAVFEKTYFDKIFQQAGYTYDWTSLANSDIRFDKRIIPYNGKGQDEGMTQYTRKYNTFIGERTSRTSFNANEANVPTYYTGGLLRLSDLITTDLWTKYAIPMGGRIDPNVIISDFQTTWNNPTKVWKNKFGQGMNVQINISMNVDCKFRARLPLGTLKSWDVKTLNGGQCRTEWRVALVMQSISRPQVLAIMDGGLIKSFNANTTYTYGTSWTSFSNTSRTFSGIISNMNANEEFTLYLVPYAEYYQTSGLPQSPILTSINTNDITLLSTIYTYCYETTTTKGVRVESLLDVTNMRMQITPQINDLVKDTPIDMSFFVPKKVKQKDLISSIIKSYNLLFLPDKDNEKNIIIKTRDEFIDAGSEFDLTPYVAIDEKNSITFQSTNAKGRNIYQYKEDKDELNKTYQDSYQEPYGTATVLLDDDFSQGDAKVELIYSPTPNTDTMVGFPLPAINGYSPENNIRVLLNNGTKTGHQYSFYDDITTTPSALSLQTTILHTSMMDNDFTPNFSICFDTPKSVFTAWQTGATSNNLFNLHYRRELTNTQDGVFLNCYAWISPWLFQKLTNALNTKLYIKDAGWFVIHKVKGYNANVMTLTQIELLQLTDEFRRKQLPPAVPVTPPIAILGNGPRRHFTHYDNLSNIIGGLNVNVNGKYNVVHGDNVTIIGDNNFVQSSDVILNGSNNTLTGGTMQFSTVSGNFQTIAGRTRNFAQYQGADLKTYANDSAAEAAGLMKGDQYTDGLGNVKVKL